MSDTAPMYLGGNEVFFSFLSATLDGVEQGHLTQEGLEATLRAWGATFPWRAGAKTTSLGLALDWTGDALATLGLVRAFTPDEAREGVIRVMVMRCLVGRHVCVERVRRGGEHRCLVAPIVEGVLATLGCPSSLVPSRQGMLRADECLLTVMLKEAPR